MTVKYYLWIVVVQYVIRDGFVYRDGKNTCGTTLHSECHYSTNKLHLVDMVEKMAILRRSASKGISSRVTKDFSHY